MRGKGNTGASKAARAYLARVDIAKFACSNPSDFRRQLDRTTEELLERLPRGARHWGLARKVLNIFLRDCLYSRQMCSSHDLQVVQDCFEIPLDSIVGKT